MAKITDEYEELTLYEKQRIDKIMKFYECNLRAALYINALEKYIGLGKDEDIPLE